MKKILLVLLAAVSYNMNGQANVTWDGGGTTNDWTDAANWSGNAVPLGGDNIIFDATSTKSCNVNISISVSDFSMLAGYGSVVDFGTIDQDIQGDLTINTGTLISTTGLLSLFGGNNYTLGGSGTYVHSNGDVEVVVPGGTTSAFSGNFVLYGLIFTAIPSNSQRNINFGSNLIVNDLNLGGTAKLYSFQGTVNIKNSFVMTANSSATPTGNTGTFIFNGSSGSIFGTPSAGQIKIPNVIINTTGGFSMSNNISVTGTWTHSNTGTYSAGTSTLNFYNATIVSGTTSAATANFDNVTVQTGSALTISGSSKVNINANLLISSGTLTCNNSQINLTGNFTDDGTYITGTSLLNLNGSGAQSIAGSNTLTTFNALEISSSGTKSLGHSINLLDSLKLSGSGVLSTGGFLTIKSTASLKGRIAEITSGGSISGNVTIETFALGGTTDWSVLGSSGISGVTMNDWYDDFPMAIEGSATDVTSASGYFESVQGWIENDAYGYDTTITIATPLTPGKGFWVFLGDNITTTGNITMDLTGTAVTGSTNIPITSGGAQSGFNLVSNPYPSPVSWAKVLALSSGVNDAVYIYNADVGQTQYVNQAASHPSTQGASNVIPMGQGFYVQSTGGTQLNFTESCKVSNNTSSNPLLKTTQSESSNSSSAGSIIHLKVEGGGAQDYCAIRFHQNATTAFDGHYDAYKIYDSPGYVGYPGIWSKRTVIGTQLNNVDYGINSIPYAHTQNAVLPVVVKVYGSGSYTISASDLQNIPVNACVTLYDKVTSITHDLRTGDYVCNINDTTNAARFVLTVCADLTANVKSQTANTNNSVGISKDYKGVFVAFDYEQPTDATISVTNILGQTIMAPKKVKASKETMYLDINTNDQLIFVTVETSSSHTTKKILNSK